MVIPFALIKYEIGSCNQFPQTQPGQMVDIDYLSTDL